jgi:hypothetical protein
MRQVDGRSDFRRAHDEAGRGAGFAPGLRPSASRGDYIVFVLQRSHPSRSLPTIRVMLIQTSTVRTPTKRRRCMAGYSFRGAQRPRSRFLLIGSEATEKSVGW